MAGKQLENRQYSNMQSYPLACHAQLQRLKGRRGSPYGVVPVGIVVEVGIAYL